MKSAEQTHGSRSKYLLVGLALVALTGFEVSVVYMPAIPTLPALLVFGSLKALLIAMFFMHLLTDRRLYSFLFAIGVFGGLLMIYTLVNLIFSHP